MSFNRIYLARFITASMRQHADELVEMGDRGEILALESFFANAEVTKVFNLCPNAKIFLDSGAFTLEHAEVKDVKKYLDDYIDYIKKWNDRLYAYANLDAIGDVEQGWKNQKYMEERGVVPVPVYHYGEDFKWLERYVNEYPYIGVGGIARGIPVRSLRNLFDRAFDYIEKRNLGTKVHGFGITGYQFLVRFPFYSVDSTTWLKQAGFGRILIPKRIWGTKEYDFMITPYVISVSDISLYKEGTEHSHYKLDYGLEQETMKFKTIDEINRYFDWIGIDPEKLLTEQAERLKANALFFIKLHESGAAQQVVDRSKAKNVRVF